MMFRRRIQIKLFAVFVMAFVCLNAGGAVCLTYCHTFDITSQQEPCPLKKVSEHCDKKDHQNNDSDTMAIAPSEIDCCPLAVTLFAAPVEGKSVSFDSVGPVLVQECSFKPALFISQQRFRSDIAYRGSPPLDRRVYRLKNRPIRI